MTDTVTILALLALIMVLPIKLAADFTDGTNTGLLACAVAAVTAPAVSLLVFRLAFGGFSGFVLAFLAGIITYVSILRIPGRSILGFSVIAIALQLASFAGLISFGVNIGRMLL